jgi:hypothetical protein
VPADFGTDISTFVDGDLDPFFRLISGKRVVGEAIVRRWTTPQGGLFFDENFGRDVRDLLGQATSPQTLFALRTALVAQAEEDERVLHASVDVSLNTQTRKLFIRGEIATADGPFTLVVAVTDLSIELLAPA